MTDRFIFADILRGLAATVVVLFHYLIKFWADDPTIARISNTTPLPLSSGLLVPIWNGTSLAFGAFGVALFFLISGFVIPASLDRMNIWDFLKARAWRILPTYFAGFCVTVAALWLASITFSKAFPYSWQEVALHAVPIVRYLSGTRYIDFVVWTLEIEIIFYVICAILAPMLRSRSLWTALVPFVMIAGSQFLTKPTDRIYLQDIAFMFTGVIISFAAWRQASSAPDKLAASAVLIASLIAIFIEQGPRVTASYGFAAGVFFLCYAAREFFPNIPPLRWIAAISYPLYVVHGIAGYVVIRILVDMQASPAIAVLFAIGCALIVSTIIHFVVELPTQRFGKITAKVRPANL